MQLGLWTEIGSGELCETSLPVRATPCVRTPLYLARPDHAYDVDDEV